MDSAIAFPRVHPQPLEPRAWAARVRPTSAPRAAAVAQALEDCRTLTLALVAPNPSTWLQERGAVRASPEHFRAFHTRGTPGSRLIQVPAPN